MATDSYVQVAADGAGKKLDTTEVTRSVATTVAATGSVTVERERVVISDPNDPNLPDATVGARGRGLSVRDDNILDVLIEIRDLLTKTYNHQLTVR